MLLHVWCMCIPYVLLKRCAKLNETLQTQQLIMLISSCYVLHLHLFHTARSKYIVSV